MTQRDMVYDIRSKLSSEGWEKLWSLPMGRSGHENFFVFLSFVFYLFTVFYVSFDAFIVFYREFSKARSKFWSHSNSSSNRKPTVREG